MAGKRFGPVFRANKKRGRGNVLDRLMPIIYGYVSGAQSLHSKEKTPTCDGGMHLC